MHCLLAYTTVLFTTIVRMHLIIQFYRAQYFNFPFLNAIEKFTSASAFFLKHIFVLLFHFKILFIIHNINIMLVYKKPVL